MKRPLCTVCLLFAAAVFACMLFLTGEGAGRSGADGSKKGSERFGGVPAISQDVLVREERIRLTGQVYQCRSYEEQTVLYLKKIAVSGKEAGTALSGISLKDLCICYCEKTTLPQIGSVVLVEGTADSFPSARNPGEFDPARYYWAQGMTFRLKNARLLSSSKSHTPLRAALFDVQQYAVGLLRAYLPEQEAGVLSAMLLGDKTSLDEEVRSLYGQSGIAHVLAISGLHISLLGAWLHRALKRMGAPMRVSMAVCCAFLFSYSMMTGMSASTLRASVMFVIGLNAGRVRRTYDLKTALAVSMAIQLLRNPRLIITAAFQLSFGAVAGIAWLMPVLRKFCEDCFLHKKGRPPKILKAFLSCLSVSLVTLPVLLAHQYEFAVYGILFNLLVLPSVSILLPAGFLLLFFAMVSDGCAGGAQFFAAAASGVPAEAKAGEMLFRAAESVLEGLGALMKLPGRAAAFGCKMILDFYERGSRLVSALPGSLLRGRPQNIRIAVYAVMLVCLVVWGRRCVRKAGGRIRAKAGREAGGRIRAKAGQEAGGRIRVKAGRKAGMRGQARLRGLLGMGWIVLALTVLLFPINRGLTITMLDVGQGDGICIEYRTGHAILADCGSSDRSRLFENRLKPFLKYRGIHTLDAVFLSHLDTDHVSAVYDLLEAVEAEHIKVKQIVVGREIPRDEAYERLLAAAQGARVPVRLMEVGEVYAEGACRLTCLGPSEETGKTGERNACSLILRLDYGDFQALFMGDADVQASLRAVRTMADCMPQDTIELLKVAHHGSRYSTSEEFLNLVSPRIALLSAGEDNSYGHPHEETITLLREQGCDIYQTPLSGAITVRVNAKGMRVVTFLGREERRH